MTTKVQLMDHQPVDEEGHFSSAALLSKEKMLQEFLAYNADNSDSLKRASIPNSSLTNSDKVGHLFLYKKSSGWSAEATNFQEVKSCTQKIIESGVNVGIVVLIEVSAEAGRIPTAEPHSLEYRRLLVPLNDVFGGYYYGNGTYKRVEYDNAYLLDSWNGEFSLGNLSEETLYLFGIDFYVGDVTEEQIQKEEQFIDSFFV